MGLEPTTRGDLRLQVELALDDQAGHALVSARIVLFPGLPQDCLPGPEDRLTAICARDNGDSMKDQEQLLARGHMPANAAASLELRQGNVVLAKGETRDRELLAAELVNRPGLEIVDVQDPHPRKLLPSLPPARAEVGLGGEGSAGGCEGPGMTDESKRKAQETEAAVTAAIPEIVLVLGSYGVVRVMCSVG